eukprot:s1586_g24.t1
MSRPSDVLAWCMPCLPQRQSERPKIKLMTLHQEIWRKILAQLEAIDLATLCQVTKELHQEICSKRLVKALGLHALHILDAPFMSFAWLGAGRLASGEDGWETLLGSLALANLPRSRWMLEVLSLNSLLSVGVSHEAMKSNALLGSNSCDSWGWEFSPKGWVETISSQQLKSQSRQLQPGLLGHGQRMILVFHLRPLGNGAGALLELAVLSFNGSWHWLDLGLRHELPALTGLRPAVSVDLGAAVRVLSSEVFLDSGC